MWDRYEFKAGDRVANADGAWAEVLSAAEAGTRLRIRYTGEGGDPPTVGTEDTVSVNDVVSVSPASPGPEWGEKVTAVLHRVPETEEAEGGFEAETMGGVPLGVSVTAFEDTAREALDRLLSALSAFGYSGPVAVEDATGLGRPERYDIDVAP